MRRVRFPARRLRHYSVGISRFFSFFRRRFHWSSWHPATNSAVSVVSHDFPLMQTLPFAILKSNCALADSSPVRPTRRSAFPTRICCSRASRPLLPVQSVTAKAVTRRPPTRAKPSYGAPTTARSSLLDARASELDDSPHAKPRAASAGENFSIPPHLWPLRRARVRRCTDAVRA